MYCDFDKIKKTLKTVNGKSTATIPTFKGDVTYTWYDQHADAVWKGDKLIRGSGCAEIATLCATMTFSDKYGKMTPYEFRHKKQFELIGNMEMPWHPKVCLKVVKNAGLRTEYYNQASLSDCYNKIRTHLITGMPVIAWVWAWPRNSSKWDKKFTDYAHVICLAGITKNDEAVILDSSRNGPLWKASLKDVCNHILPGTWLHGFILVYPDILYRVRKTWRQYDTQKGAFAKLENAQNLVRELYKMGEVYTVYDSSGNPVWPLYRVRKDPDDMETQLGAFVFYANAVRECELHPGYHIVDLWGKVSMTATDNLKVPVVVKIADGVKLYSDPDGRMSVGIFNEGKYTIMEVKEYEGSYYGRLKSDAGWVNMDDVRANI